MPGRANRRSVYAKAARTRRASRAIEAARSISASKQRLTRTIRDTPGFPCFGAKHTNLSPPNLRPVKTSSFLDSFGTSLFLQTTEQVPFSSTRLSLT